MRIRLLFSLLTGILTAWPLQAQEDQAESLFGRVEQSVYYSASGLFAVPVPVIPDLGGRISDTSNVVTFSDQFTMHVSIAAYPLEANHLRELETRGRKDYLMRFFSDLILPEFRQNLPGTRVESARFIASVQGGSVLLYSLIPGGTMFPQRLVNFLADAPVPVAKRGNLLFIHGDTLYILSSELAERAIEGSCYTLTTPEEDELLRTRLLKIAQSMQFAPPVPAPAPAPATPPVSQPATP